MFDFLEQKEKIEKELRMNYFKIILLRVFYIIKCLGSSFNCFKKWYLIFDGFINLLVCVMLVLELPFFPYINDAKQRLMLAKFDEYDDMMNKFKEQPPEDLSDL